MAKILVLYYSSCGHIEAYPEAEPNELEKL